MESETLVRKRITAFVVLGGILLMGGIALRQTSWRADGTVHTIMEVAATLLALFVGIIALVRYYSKNGNTYLFIGAGFLGTGLLDGYHTIATFAPFSGAFPSLPPSLAPWSWIASRLFLSVLLFLSWWACRREERLHEGGKIGEGMVYGVTGVLTVAGFLFFALTPLPRAYYPEFVVGRPEEFLPGLFFLLALVGYLRAGHWKKDAFIFFLVLSIIAGLAVQVAFMPFSHQLYDASFDVAHLVKHLSYLFVLTGLLVSMYGLFRQADESVHEIRATNSALLSEIRARAQVERTLKETHDELERRVEERTATVSRTNDLLTREIAERRRTELALRHSEAQIRLLLNSTGEAIYGVDLEGNCTFCNQACLKLLGFEDERELLGQNMHDLIHHSRPDGEPYPVEACKIYRAFREGASAHVEDEVLWRKDGGSFPAEYWSYPLRQDGQDIGCVVTFIDATARKANEANLQKTKEAAEAANRAKSEFLANMSHELRTPLNGILGYAQILMRDDTLAESHRTGIEVIEHSGKHLLSLINDILDLSKIEAGKMEVQPSEIHLPEFLQSIADIGRIRAEQKGLAFRYTSRTPLPGVVWGDERRLRQILLNLLSNAVKFTDRGGVAFEVGCVETPSDAPRLRFQVEDTGRGIAPEELEEIFHPFQQIGNLEGPLDGTGLGLAISRRLTALMDGTLTVSSTPGLGSAFRLDLDLPALDLDLPALDLDLPALDLLSSTRARAKGSIIGFEGPARKVLVVDDKRENRSFLTQLLTPLGFAVKEAEHGREALDRAVAFLPDLILMDLVMPVMDGFEAARRIRRMPALDGTPIIALSASVFEDTQRQSLTVGCDDFLPKPVQIDALLDRMKHHLDLRWRYRQATSPAGEAPPAAAEDRAAAPPQPDQASTLYAFAIQGDIQGLLRQLDAYEHLRDARHPFGSRLRELARSYRMERIRKLIEPYLEPNA